jgi:hypothetical protein
LVAARFAGVEAARIGVERDDRHARLQIGEDAAGIAGQGGVEVAVGIDRTAVIDCAVHPGAVIGDAGIDRDQRAAIFAHRLQPRLEPGIFVIVRHEPEWPAPMADIGDAPEPPRRTLLAELDAADSEPRHSAGSRWRAKSSSSTVSGSTWSLRRANRGWPAQRRQRPRERARIISAGSGTARIFRRAPGSA